MQFIYCYKKRKCNNNNNNTKIILKSLNPQEIKLTKINLIE